MSLDVVDTVLSSLSRIASRATLGVIGVVLAVLVSVGVLGAIAGMLTSISLILAGLVGVAALVVYIAGAACLTVGSLRAFDQEDFNKEMFTDNIIWPFLRMTGSNIVTQAFTFAAAYLLLYPLLLIGIMGSGAMADAGNLGLGLLGGMSAAGTIALGLILYIFATLTLSLPRIAVDDKRMFQALDESVQSTSGNRFRVIATLIPFALLLAAAFAGLFQEGILGMAVYAASILLGSLYYLAILTELNTRL